MKWIWIIITMTLLTIIPTTKANYWDDLWTAQGHHFSDLSFTQWNTTYNNATQKNETGGLLCSDFIDNDLNGVIDANDINGVPTGEPKCYYESAGGFNFGCDYDADGYGTNDANVDCYGAGTQDDWNDFDTNTYPGAPEVCDGADNNGNGFTDEGFDSTNCNYISLNSSLKEVMTFDYFNSTTIFSDVGSWSLPYNETSKGIGILNNTGAYFNYSMWYNGSKYVQGYLMNSNTWDTSKNFTIIIQYKEITASSTYRVLDGFRTTLGGIRFLSGTNTPLRYQGFAGSSLTSAITAIPPLVVSPSPGSWYMATFEHYEERQAVEEFIYNFSVNQDLVANISNGNFILTISQNSTGAATPPELMIDNIYVWNRILTPCEISYIYTYTNTYYTNWSTANITGCNRIITPSCPAQTSCPATTNNIAINILTGEDDPNQEDTLITYNGQTLLSKKRNRCQNA